MKIALALYGHMRTAGVLESQWKELADTINPDIYISTWNYIGHWNPIAHNKEAAENPGTVIHNSGMTVDETEIRELFPHSKIEIQNYDDYSPIFTAGVRDACAWRDSLNGMYSSYRCHSYFSMYYKRYRAVDMIKNSYDAIILTRPDIRFNLTSLDDLDTNIHVCKNTSDPYSDLWVNDIAFMSTQQNIKSLVNMFVLWNDKLENCKLNNTPEIFFEPHTMTCHHIVKILGLGLKETINGEIVR